MFLHKPKCTGLGIQESRVFTWLPYLVSYQIMWSVYAFLSLQLADKHPSSRPQAIHMYKHPLQSLLLTHNTHVGLYALNVHSNATHHWHGRKHSCKEICCTMIFVFVKIANCSISIQCKFYFSVFPTSNSCTYVSTLILRAFSSK